MKRLRRIVLGGVALLLLVLVLNAAYGRTIEPMDAVYAQAERMGYEREALTVLAGGYSQGLFAWEAYGLFHPADADAESELLVVVERPTPLHAWRLRTLASGPNVGR